MTQLRKNSRKLTAQIFRFQTYTNLVAKLTFSRDSYCSTAECNFSSLYLMCQCVCKRDLSLKKFLSTQSINFTSHRFAFERHGSLGVQLREKRQSWWGAERHRWSRCNHQWDRKTTGLLWGIFRRSRLWDCFFCDSKTWVMWSGKNSLNSWRKFFAQVDIFILPMLTRFFPFSSDWVLLLGPQEGENSHYQYSVVSDPLRLFLFVLCRDVAEFKQK